MVYDPFSRGPHPVGVRTATLRDEARSGRELTVEIWYPATDAVRGRDLDSATQDRFEVLPGFLTGSQEAVRDAAPRTGHNPLIVFSHGFGTERRQSSFLCTHLASHGYRVCAPDHSGNTMVDMMRVVMERRVLNVGGEVEQMARDRPLDLAFVMRAFDGDTNVGVAGHSFGGWTALTTAAREPRVRAVLALAPAGGHGALVGEALADKLELGFDGDVATQLIVADRDSLLPLAGMHDIYRRIAAQKRMFVLLDADHMHFCDRPRTAHEMFRMVPTLAASFNVQELPPFSELCPEEHALTALRGLGLAHFDAALLGHEQARAFIEEHAMSALARRGIQIDRV